MLGIHSFDGVRYNALILKMCSTALAPEKSEHLELLDNQYTDFSFPERKYCPKCRIQDHAQYLVGVY